MNETDRDLLAGMALGAVSPAERDLGGRRSKQHAEHGGEQWSDSSMHVASSCRVGPNLDRSCTTTMWMRINAG